MQYVGALVMAGERQPVLRCGSAPACSTSKREQQTTFAQLVFWNCSETGLVFSTVWSNLEAACRTAARGPQCKSWERAGIPECPVHMPCIWPCFLYWELLGGTWVEWSPSQSLCWVFLIKYVIGTEMQDLNQLCFCKLCTTVVESLC